MTAPGADHVRIEDAKGVRSLILNRPEKKNALTHAMYAALADGLVGADADPALRAVLLAAEGDAFTAGNDLNDFLAGGAEAVSGIGGTGDKRPVVRFLEAIGGGQTPLVAAVQGRAVGIGLTMLLHCDLVVASEDAELRAPFIDLGLPPEAASTLLLPQRVGQAKAAEILLLAAPVPAREALALGLVNAVVPRDRLRAEALARAQALAAKPPGALREARALLRGDRRLIAERMAEEGRLFAACLAGEEFREAASAFFEKRAPDFSRFR